MDSEQAPRTDRSNKRPNIGCTITQIGTTIHPITGQVIPTFEIVPNDPEAYRRLIEVVKRDVARCRC